MDAACNIAKDIASTNATLTDEKRLYNTIHYYMMGVGTPVVCGFGLIGNTLNLLVLTREKKHRHLTKMEKSAHMGLIALAFSDFMFCLLAMLFTILPLQDHYPQKSIVLYYDYFGGSFISIFIICSTWLIVCMAGERYFAVCHPFRARKIISLKKTRISITLIFVCCTLFSTPLFLERVIEEVSCSNGNNGTWYVIKHRHGYTTNMVAVRRLVWSILADFVPCISLVFFNTCLIWKIQKAKTLRKKMSGISRDDKSMFTSSTAIREKNSKYYTTPNSSSHNKEESKDFGTALNKKPLNGHQHSFAPTRTCSHVQLRTNPHGYRRRDDSALNSVTATLVAVVVLFLILVSPSEILKFATYYMGKFSNKNYTYLMIRDVTNFMQAVNFSVNFILYCAVNKSFRQTLASILCFCRMSVQIKIVRKPPRHRSFVQSRSCDRGYSF
ncbi:neurotensin receptor type 1-like [Liolophura sinensis]|uniref:neurotensin receptor type 1-like n=1 Tax=Liolophura sinensis TaxID=3198878 RepID=UPI0031583938